MKNRRPIYNQNKQKQKSKYILSIVGILVLIVAVTGFYLYGVKDRNDDSQEQGNPQDNVSKNEDVKDNGDKKESAKDNDSNKDKTNDEDKKTDKSKDQTVNKSGYIEGQKLPKEPTYIDGVLIANKKYPLPKDYAPGEDAETRKAFEKMAADAKKAGFELTAFSTYRSYEYQETLYSNYVAKDGKANADRYSARPGYSEHQTGLAMDIGEVGKEDLWLTEEFGETPAGQWLFDNAVNYGFILRFPKGKENITGYMYESWHYRYLGVDLAKKVKESGVTLEEYLGIE